MPDYPDVSDIFARKEAGRRDLAKLDFWEKVRRMEALRERLRPLKEAREAAKSAREASDRKVWNPAHPLVRIRDDTAGDARRLP